MNDEFKTDLAKLGETVEAFNRQFVLIQQKYDRIAHTTGFVRCDQINPDRLIVTVREVFAEFGRSDDDQ